MDTYTTRVRRIETATFTHPCHDSLLGTGCSTKFKTKPDRALQWEKRARPKPSDSNPFYLYVAQRLELMCDPRNGERPSNSRTSARVLRKREMSRLKKNL